ncbi:MAG TPA: thiolase family protein [Planctomycetota bacterium]|nr:thiolase family protein [Planctomycetota bacterium]
MPEAVITNAIRTPIGKFLGGLSDLSAVELGTFAVRGLLDRAGIPLEDVDEVLFGHARQLGSGPNPARQVSIAAGLPETCPAQTLNRACGSGLEAVVQAARMIRSGEADCVIAGGMESMTNMPFLLPDMRRGYRLGHARVEDGTYTDGFQCRIVGEPMGKTAEYLADEHSITREEQDAYALRSFERWEAAEAAGRFDAERLVLEWQDKKGRPQQLASDEHGRRGMTLEALAKLPPVFRTLAEGGSVHAGNSSGITDGAAALLVTSRDYADQHGLEVLAQVRSWKHAGVSPRLMGRGPVPAVRALCDQEGLTVDDFDLIELNEAFAAQVIACDRELRLPGDRLNVNGGAIALGHPIGCTGARIVATLLHELQRRDGKLGLATLCISGGQGMAVAFER